MLEESRYQLQAQRSPRAAAELRHQIQRPRRNLRCCASYRAQPAARELLNILLERAVRLLRARQISRLQRLPQLREKLRQR